MKTKTHAILWRRLDHPGHDACRLIERGSGWRLQGAAVFRNDEGLASLAYEIDADSTWRTERGDVRGWIGERSFDVSIARSVADGWTLNGDLVSGLDGCVDLDLGFTPATNLFQLRRVGLQVGESADVPVAWLDASAAMLEKLDQRYQRRAPRVYWYEAPRFHYRGLLHVSTEGFVEEYPGLWKAE